MANYRFTVPQASDVGYKSTVLKSGEVVYDTTEKTLVIGDGVTAGGNAVGGNMNFTINGNAAVDGNFNIGHADVGAAPEIHQHEIADINDLQTQLNGKASSDHSHPSLSGFKIGTAGALTTGNVTLMAGQGCNITKSGQTITIGGKPVEHDIAGALTTCETDSKQVKIFTGTATEWTAFTKEAGITYIALIHN